MVNTNYCVSKDKVYAGTVIKPLTSFEANEDYCEQKKGDIIIAGYKLYRSILFTPTVDNYVDDLLYNTPDYPILGLSDKEDIIWSIAEPEDLIVLDPYNLGEFLELSGYQEELSY